MNFYIPGELATLNDFIAAMNRNRYDGAQIKRLETQRVKMACRELHPVGHYPVDLRLTWYRADRRSDPDNVAFAIKFILDGLQQAGIIKQDNWKCVNSITHNFELDAENPGVEIVISEEI